MRSCSFFILLITAFTLVGFDQRGSAQSTSAANQRDGKPIKLQWKLAEGETLYYEQREEQMVRESVGNNHLAFKDRRYFLYRWDVLLDDGPLSPGGVPMSVVSVSFERILRESVTPERTILADTYAPVGSDGLSTEAKQMQDEIFGMLGSNFVFFVTPDGGTALPNDLTGIEVPQEMRVPETVHSPRSFTPGDIVGFPEAPVSIGDSWTVSVNVDGVTGSGRYRLAGESRRNGRKCLLIEGETSYDKLPAHPNQEAIVSARVGPRTSTYCFDAERGRLIEGNEVIPIEMTFVDGQTRSTTVRVRRELIEQPKEPELVELTRKIADGKVLKFSYRGGNPVNARGEWADITGAGLTLGLAQQNDGLIKAEKLIWIVMLKPKRSHKIQGVTVHDVTFDEPVLMLELSKPEPKDGVLSLQLKGIDISKSAPEWFERDEITERIFEIVLRNDQGDSRVLYQPVLIPTGQLREQTKLLEQQ